MRGSEPVARHAGEGCAIRLREPPRSRAERKSSGKHFGVLVRGSKARIERTLIHLSAESAPRQALPVTRSIGDAGSRHGARVEAVVEHSTDLSGMVVTR